MKVFKLLLILFFIPVLAYGQANITGTIRDKETGELLIGAAVVIKGTSVGNVTDLDGKFTIPYEGKFPVTLHITYVGYQEMDYEVKNATDKIKINLLSEDYQLETVEIQGSRITEKQKENPLTVESLDIIAIKETPSADFYESLGHLKGVDLTSASIGFKIVNTRGFNSTSPVRSLQIIDFVDNQAPGLNFSLGNFLGASELDLQRVELVVGAASAYFGPNAFNGVISMTTKDPFIHKGFSALVKGGERGLFETAVRYADVIKNKKGEDKFAFKLNVYYMMANDWEATNMNPSSDSDDDESNWGGYDAVHRYGDENLTDGINNASSLGQQVIFPGLKRWYRTGYLEPDLADYNTRNIKTSLGLFYKLNKDVKITYSFNFGSGTTVYQGDNRFSLKGIKFMQNRIEINKENKFFIRAYSTNEDAGKSYDIVRTALMLQKRDLPLSDWSRDYRNNWQLNYTPKVKKLPGFPNVTIPIDEDWWRKADSVMNVYSDSLVKWHDETRALTDKSRLVPGTKAFEDAFNDIISKRSGKGGTGFYDKSALYHVHGEYKFTPKLMDIVVGGNYRLYKPKSDGTIFSDTNGIRIQNSEFGVYGGIQKSFADDKIKLNITARFDKNENFKPVVSPAASVVYKLNENNVFRISFSSALRNPTLSDQYLYFDVGPAILIGNLNGFDSLITLESLGDYFSSKNLDKSLLNYFNVAPIQPEKVNTIEIGYRGTLFNQLYVDVSYYHSWYRDFIGYEIGAEVAFDPVFDRISYLQIYRIASNATSQITTQGFSLGLNYYIDKNLTLTTNYSWNKLAKKGTDDPIIPAYNTPENKFNLGFSARDLELNFGKTKTKHWGFGFNLKWVEGYIFEGSPQFTGFVPTYYLFDAQINKSVPRWKTTFKLGGSNLFNNNIFTVYGGPYIGRIVYFSVLLEIPK
jgi:iron complex outermembrane recepter protein